MAKKITSIKQRISTKPYVGEEVLKQANKAKSVPTKTVNSNAVKKKTSKSTIKPKLKKQ